MNVQESTAFAIIFLTVINFITFHNIILFTYNQFFLGTKVLFCIQLSDNYDTKKNTYLIINILNILVM